jgi:hypothetical protein
MTASKRIILLVDDDTDVGYGRLKCKKKRGGAAGAPPPPSPGGGGGGFV